MNVDDVVLRFVQLDGNVSRRSACSITADCYRRISARVADYRRARIAALSFMNVPRQRRSGLSAGNVDRYIRAVIRSRSLGSSGNAGAADGSERGIPRLGYPGRLNIDVGLLFSSRPRTQPLLPGFDAA